MRISWPFWVFGRMRSLTLPVGVGTGTSAPSSGFGQGDRQLDPQVGAAALESRVGLDPHVDDEVAPVHGAAQLHLGPFAHAGWNLHVKAAAVHADHSLGAGHDLGQRHLGGRARRSWRGRASLRCGEVREVDVLEAAAEPGRSDRLPRPRRRTGGRSR